MGRIVLGLDGGALQSAVPVWITIELLDRRRAEPRVEGGGLDLDSASAL
jgi:hypothetical protein